MTEQHLERVISEIETEACESIRLLRRAVREAPPSSVSELLAQAVEVLREIESIELRLELALIAENVEDAREHALDAHALAVALREAIGARRTGAPDRAEVPS
jgi:hypothetical protein